MKNLLIFFLGYWVAKKLQDKDISSMHELIARNEELLKEIEPLLS